jgi:hypothetical protein
MNALRHGLRARRVVLPNEDQEEFDQIHAGLQDQYQPQNAAEQYLVYQAAIAQWKLVRAEVFEADCYAETPSPNARAAIFGRMSQVQCRLERAFFKAYKELERIKTAREKRPEQSKESDKPPAKVNLRWVNGANGKSEILCKLENGKAVKNFRDASPSSSPQDPPQTKPTIPPR